MPTWQPTLSRYESARRAAGLDFAARLDELLDADGALLVLLVSADDARPPIRSDLARGFPPVGVRA